MKKGYCHITAVIDRSGSMAGLEKEVIGSFNKFVDDQKEVEGKATLTLIQFDNMYEVNYEAKDIQDVPKLNKDTYMPRGMTAMLDAIGKSILTTGDVLSTMDESERPEKVVFLIQTDGMENASKEFDPKVVKKMIREQEDTYSWEFVFLGSNIDAVDTAVNIGIKSSNAMDYAATDIGTKSAINSLSENLASYRGGSKADMSYEGKDFKAQKEAGI